MRKIFYLIGAISVILAGIVFYSQKKQNQYYKLVENSYKIINRYDRTPDQYTQCLAFYNETHLLETSGLYEQSSVHFLNYDIRADVISSPLTSFNLTQTYNKKYFAEGCVLYNDKVHVLTYKENEMLIFDSQLKNQIDAKPYPSFIKEGWGLTYHNNTFIMTDGTNNLYFFHPDTFELIKVVKVNGCKGQYGCSYLNELEMYKGKLLANIYYSNSLYVINIETGQVEKEYNMQLLADEVLDNIKDPFYFRKGFVFNGIAYDPTSDTLLVTGKSWPYIYKIELLNFPSQESSN